MEELIIVTTTELMDTTRELNMETVIPSLLNKSEKFFKVGFRGIHWMGRAMIAP